jgi:hypothetical protein
MNRPYNYYFLRALSRSERESFLRNHRSGDFLRDHQNYMVVIFTPEGRTMAGGAFMSREEYFTPSLSALMILFRLRSHLKN